MGGLSLTAGSLPTTSGGVLSGKEGNRLATSSHLKKSLEDMEKRRFAIWPLKLIIMVKCFLLLQNHRGPAGIWFSRRFIQVNLDTAVIGERF